MMRTRIDASAALVLARQELPRPLDVLNLIQLGDERSYARYGLAVTPLMGMVGARLQWMGEHVRQLAGDSQAERLMVVRYRSHRRFLAMTLNPYYLLINRLRERGVRAFQASFTHPDQELLELRPQRALLVAHFEEPLTLEAVRAAIEPHAGPLVYASREVATIDILRGRRPTDPNPLAFRQTACFAVPEREPAALDLAALGDGSGPAVALYRRVSPRTLLAKAR